MLHIINFDGEKGIDCIEINDDYLVIDYLDNQSEEWKIDEDGVINANCCCMDCREIFNELEEMDFLYRAFIHGGWRWMIKEKKEKTMKDIQQPIIFRLPFGQGFYCIHPSKKIALFLKEDAIFPRRINFSHFDCEKLNEFNDFWEDSQNPCLKTGFWSCWLG